MGVWKGAKSVEGDHIYIYDQESEFVWVLSSQPSIPPSCRSEEAFIEWAIGLPLDYTDKQSSSV